MLFIVLSFHIDGMPAGRFRSIETFNTAQACMDAITSDASNRELAVQNALVYHGVALRIEAECRDPNGALS